MDSSNSFLDWIHKLRAGDARAAEEIFRRYAERLISLAAQHLTGSLRYKVDPEDLAQSALKSFFLRDASKPFTLDSWEDLWGLLATITLRKCSQQARWFLADKRSVAHEQPLDSDMLATQIGEPSPEEAIALADLVQHLLNGLVEPTRHIAELMLQGYSAAETAEKMRLSERTVYRQFNLIRLRLSEIASEEEFRP